VQLLTDTNDQWPRRFVFEESPSGDVVARDAGATVLAVGSVPWGFDRLARVDDLRSISTTATDRRLVLAVA